MAEVTDPIGLPRSRPSAFFRRQTPIEAWRLTAHDERQREGSESSPGANRSGDDGLQGCPAGDRG